MDDFEYHGTPRKIKRLWRVFFVLLALFIFPLYPVYGLSAPEPVGYGRLHKLPWDEPNSKWVCMEADICLISGRHSCVGEAKVNGRTVFFHVFSDYDGGDLAFAHEMIATCREETRKAKYKEGYEELFSGQGTRDANCCRLVIPAENFHLWETEEDVHLTFLRRTLDEEIYFEG